MTDKQPEALWIAKYFDDVEISSHRTRYGTPIHMAAAAELRRQHEVIDDLCEALTPFVLTNSSDYFVSQTVRSSNIAKARAAIQKAKEKA